MAKNSRGRSRERKVERKKEKQRQRMMQGAVLIGVLAVIAVAVFIMVNQPADAPIPDYAFERYKDIPKGKTADGFPILGKADAPIRFEEYSSFSCSACASFHESSAERLVELVRQGIISYTFIPITNTGSVPNGEGAARAALCAGEQGLFFEYHDALFSWHLNFGNQAFSHNRLSSGVENLSLNSGQYDSCLNSSETNQTLENAAQNYLDINPTGTPTIVINGVKQTVTDIDALEQVIMTQLAASELVPVPLDGEGNNIEATEEAVMEEPEATEEANQETEATEEATEEAN